MPAYHTAHIHTWRGSPVKGFTRLCILALSIELRPIWVLGSLSRSWNVAEAVPSTHPSCLTTICLTHCMRFNDGTVHVCMKVNTMLPLTQTSVWSQPKWLMAFIALRECAYIFAYYHA